MSHEAIHNLDRRNRADEIAETAEKLLGRHETVSSLLEQASINPLELIDESDPNDIYSLERVQRDLNRVEERNQQFAEGDREKLPNGLTKAEVYKLAEIAEYDILRGINMGNWIPSGRALVTSEYDDVFNGIDMVLEVGQKEGPIGHYGLAVDVSFSQNLNAKFQRIKNEIDSFDNERNRLGRVKYFKSRKAGIRGELSGIPRVVAALDLPAMEDMAVKSDRLEGHIGQALLIENMERQLATFHEYAQDVNPACAPQFERSLAMVRAVDQMTGASERLSETEYTKNDGAREAVDRGLSLFT